MDLLKYVPGFLTAPIIVIFLQQPVFTLIKLVVPTNFSETIDDNFFVGISQIKVNE